MQGKHFNLRTPNVGSVITSWKILGGTLCISYKNPVNRKSIQYAESSIYIHTMQYTMIINIVESPLLKLIFLLLTDKHSS